MARRPDTLFATNIASLIFLPDLRFLALTSFQSLNRPSLRSGSSSRISLLKQSFSVSRPRLRPPGNIHRWSRLLLTNNTRPRFVATSFDDFAIRLPHCLNTESSVQILFHPVHEERQRLVRRTVERVRSGSCLCKKRFSYSQGHFRPVQPFFLPDNVRFAPKADLAATNWGVPRVNVPDFAGHYQKPTVLVSRALLAALHLPSCKAKSVSP
jgi:hypothetical protein